MQTGLPNAPGSTPPQVDLKNPPDELLVDMIQTMLRKLSSFKSDPVKFYEYLVRDATVGLLFMQTPKFLTVLEQFISKELTEVADEKSDLFKETLSVVSLVYNLFYSISELPLEKHVSNLNQSETVDAKKKYWKYRVAYKGLEYCWNSGFVSQNMKHNTSFNAFIFRILGTQVSILTQYIVNLENEIGYQNIEQEWFEVADKKCKECIQWLEKDTSQLLELAIAMQNYAILLKKQKLWKESMDQFEKVLSLKKEANESRCISLQNYANTIMEYLAWECNRLVPLVNSEVKDWFSLKLSLNFSPSEELKTKAKEVKLKIDAEKLISKANAMFETAVQFFQSKNEILKMNVVNMNRCTFLMTVWKLNLLTGTNDETWNQQILPLLTTTFQFFEKERKIPEAIKVKKLLLEWNSFYGI